MKNKVYNENAKENKLILICSFTCWIIVSFMGMEFFWNNQNSYSVADAISFFALMFVPWIVSVSIYRFKPNSSIPRRIVYITSIFLYSYIAATGKPIYMELFILPLLVSTIVYSDIKVLITYGLGLFVMGAISSFVAMPEYKDKESFRLIAYATFIYFVMTIFLVIASRLIHTKQNKKNAEINRERDRFEAIVSVGVEKIFEYNIKEDMVMTAESSGGSYGKEKYICNFSSVAKSQKYIPFSDWYRFDEILFECKTGTSVIEKELRIREELSDEYRWNRIRARVMFDEEGVPEKLIGAVEDIEDAKKLEIRLADEKMRDPITRLYKRSYLTQFVDEYIAKNEDSLGALLILDIDGYRKLNEEMGTAFGDEILKNIAEDIRNLFYESDLMGRIGDDEFVIYMKNIDSSSDIEKKIKEIQKVIVTTYTGENEKKRCTVSIGAAVYSKDGDSYENLYRAAEKALNLAQSKGPSHYDIYDPIKENVYAILANELSNRHQKKVDENRRNYVSNSIIELAFKLIDESKDTDSAINLLIRQMCRQMSLGAIIIKTKVKDEKAMKIMYNYGIDPIRDDMYIINYGDKEWEANLALYARDDISICRSIEDVESEDVKQYMMAFGIEAFVGCPFYERGSFAGTIDFLDMEREREWTEEEIRNIKSVTNVVSSYLLKMKAYEDASETVERLTGYDAVTGLYKYEKFLALAGDYIATAEHGNYAVAYLDMFNFKYLNDTYGYEVGDQVLQDMADTIRAYPEQIVMGSRVFSDNMVVLLKLGEMSMEDIKNGIGEVVEHFSETIKQRFLDSRLDVGIGICTFTINGGPVMIQSIISNANMARKRTKNPLMPRIIFYDDQMGHAAKNEIAYANDMENAVKNREFVVYMQPKVNLKNDKIEGAEALVRWKKEDGSIIYPNDFIPVFERNKSVTLLDYYVYEEVCRYIRSRLDANLPVVSVSTNVSRVHLYAIDEIISKIKSLIDKYKIPPQYLEFELTETSFTDKVDDTIRLMSKLRGLGVKVSMDDFGSGYSSLNVLTKLPLDVLKIDKEFLRDFETDSEEKIVIPSVIAMAKKLNLEVVCEGVETLEQVEFLREINCDYAQGYYYSKPIPQEDFNKMLEG